VRRGRHLQVSSLRTVFRVNQAVAAGAAVRLDVLPEAGYSLPPAGVRTGTSDFVLSGTVGSQSLNPGPVPTVQAIGAFARSPALAFGTRVAGAATALTFGFEARMVPPLPPVLTGRVLSLLPY